MRMLKLVLAATIASATALAVDSIDGLYVYVQNKQDPKNTRVERLQVIAGSGLMYTPWNGNTFAMEFDQRGDFLLATVQDADGKHYYPIYRSPDDGSLHMAGKTFQKTPGKRVTDPKTEQQICSICGARVFIAFPGATTKNQIREFARSSRIQGKESIERDGWIHPGAYCPNGCIEEWWNVERK